MEYHHLVMDIDVTALKEALHPTHHDVRVAVQNLLREDLFVPRYNISLEEDRLLTRQRLLRIASQQFLSPSDYQDDPCKIFVVHQCLTLVDSSLVSAFTIQFNLFVGSLINLSTEKHFALIPDVLSMKIVGTFALTEIDVGSNTLHLKTTSTYDPRTQTFDLHTPTDGACKFWVSGYKQTHAIVFAKLISAGEDQGVQAFLTPLRREDGSLLPGVEELDLGSNIGTSGTGASLLRFSHFKMPLDSLMDRFSKLAPDGTFTSKFSNKRQRFIKAIERLITGRIVMTVSTLAGTELSALIAYRYAAQRLAVGPTGKSDTPIMSYQLQQNALVPYIARMFVLEFGAHYAIRLFREGNSFLSTYACALKSLASWTTNRFARIARERMGGAGYLAVNRLSSQIAASEGVITAEGDLGILMIKTVNDIMSKAAKGKYVPPQLKMCPVRQLPQVADYDSLELLLELMRAREAFAFKGLIEKLQACAKVKTGAFEVLCKTDAGRVQHLGISFGERILAEQALEAIGLNPRVTEILSLITELYMLDVVKNDMNWFMLAGFVNAAAAKKIVERWTAAIKRLAPHLDKVTAAYDIPEDLVRSPAAGDYVGYNDRHLNGELMPKL